MKKQPKTERRGDYVRVRLTEAGEALSGGALRVTNRHLDYEFKPGEEQEVVERYEWTHVLRKMRTAEGALIFELAGEQAAAQADAAQITDEGVNDNGGV